MKIKVSKVNLHAKTATNMKTTVPNMSQGKVSTQNCSSSTSAAATKSKDLATNKNSLEKELEEVNKQLGCSKKDVDASNELKLIEHRILLMLKLKQWPNVTEEGYKILGKKGPNPVIYKCILISLCRLGKFEDVIEVLDQWKRYTPKCVQMQDTKQTLDGYLTALRSGIDATNLLQNLEDVIKVEIGSCAQTSSLEPNWKFRPPPQRHNTFSLCSRIASGITCMYGNDCLSAHSKEELKEWQQRTALKNNKENIVTDTLTVATTTPKAIPREQIPQQFRILPPACMYYLAGLVKKLQETKNIKTLFVDILSDVKIKLSTPASVSKRLVHGRPIPINHKWSFMIASKKPLATATLLHDKIWDRFSITGAFFFNSKRQTLDLIDLHPNNKAQKDWFQGIQVLNTFIRPELFLPFNNGWPEWSCYQIDVVFQTVAIMPGKFEQDIIFDFKSDPKICRRLSVTLEPAIVVVPPSQDKPMPVAPLKINSSNSSSEEALERDFRETVLLNIPNKPNNINNATSAKSEANSSIGSESQSVSDSDSDDNLDEDIKDSNLAVGRRPLTSTTEPLLNNITSSTSNAMALPTNSYFSTAPKENSRFEEVDSVAGLLVRQWVNGTEASYNKLIEDLEDEALTKENYVSWMNRFIVCEIKAREQELLKLSGKSDINIFNATSAGVNTSLSVGLYGKLFLAKDLNGDSKIGRLVFNNCRSISIGEIDGSVASKPRTYVCRVINKTEQAIVILIGRKAVEELNLSYGTTRKLDVWLHLDHSYLDLLKVVLQGVTDYHQNLLFPAFTDNQPWDISSLVNSSMGRPHLDESLNINQRDGMHAILSDSKSVSDSKSQVPVLVTGPPGSGKSYLIARSIMSIFNSQKTSKFPCANRILICTFTNKAADEFITEHFHPWLSKSESGRSGSFLLRIYNADQMVNNISQVVKKYSLLVNDETSFRYPTLDELLSFKIIIVTVSTCLELLQLGLPDYIFSHVFLDECHRMIEVESLCPILLAGKNSRIVVAGDMKLLDPETFTLPTLTSKCQSVTLVERLSNIYPQRHPFRVRLEETYSNNQDIVQFISNEFYSSSLKCNKSQPSHPKYHPLTFSIVSGGEDCQPDHGDGYYNMKEIYEIRDRICELIRAWPSSWESPKDHSIGVITPYPDQVLGLRIKLKLEGLSFVDVEALPNVLTKQYRVVLISAVRTFRNEKLEDLKLVRESDAGGGFFTNPKAIYTAMTRAKNLFIVLGDLVSLCNVGGCKDIWRQFVSVCRQNNSLLGLPTNPGSSSVSQVNNVVSPISRPSPSPNSFKRSELVSSSPNLGSIETNNKSQQQDDSPITMQSKLPLRHEPLKKISTLSSIWNTPEVPLVSTCRMEPSSSIASACRDIWNDNPRTTLSLGNLADPSSIWSTTAFTQKPSNNIGGDNFNISIGNDKSRSGGDSSIAVGSKPSVSHSHNSSFSCLDEDHLYKSPFDLPDVRLMAESALGTKIAQNSAESNLAVSPYRNVYQQPVIKKSPLPENQRYSASSYANGTSPVNHANASLHWSKGPNKSLTVTSHSSQSSQDQVVSRTCTNFEIAQANYAYYHGPPRRLGYTPPPRMLRTFKPLGQLTQADVDTSANTAIQGFENYNISAKAGYLAKEAPKNFDFFTELDLKSDTQTLLESSSSSSSSHENNEEGKATDSNFMLNSSEFPGLGGTSSAGLAAKTLSPGGWTEVKNVKKSKNKEAQPEQKKKSKKNKAGTNIISISALPSGGEKKMSVDEMICSLKDMGFDKRQAIKALQHCNRDLERAVEWLIASSSNSIKKE